MDSTTTCSGSQDSVQDRFDAFVSPHLHAMCQYARQLAGDDDFEDVVQEVLLKLYLKGLPGEALKEPRAWLLHAVRNRAIDWYRQRRREREVEVGGLLCGEDGELEMEFADDAPGPEELAHQEEQRAQIAAALQWLAVSQREVIHLHHVCGYTLVEISRWRRVPFNTLKSALSRGCCDLRLQAAGAGSALRESPRPAMRRRRRMGAQLPVSEV